MRSKTSTKSVRFRPGFTLVEAALTTMIVGLGTVAMLSLLAAGTSANQQSAKLTTAINLANNIHELTDRLPFADPSNAWGIPTGQAIGNLLNVNGTTVVGNVTWLDGQTFNPPVDATNSAINNLSGWSQVIAVHSVDGANITSNAATNNTSPPPTGSSMSRVSVSIITNGQTLFSTSWLVAR